MTNIDQFESLFKAADKPQFELQKFVIERVLLVCDQDDEHSRVYAQRVRDYLAVLGEFEFETLSNEEFDSVGDLLQQVGKAEPDLICTYRNLRIPAREYPYSLGVYVDVLTQVTEIPILVLPHPVDVDNAPDILGERGSVMAITDHLAGDARLVSAAVHFSSPGGKLHLAHVEDALTFNRYMEVIGKIPAIDTDLAKQAILEQLLKEPNDYIESCRSKLKEEGLEIEIEKVVKLGRHLADYRQLAEEHEVRLMVLNTKDEDQLAMHGLAYPLTIELRKTPLLLL